MQSSYYSFEYNQLITILQGISGVPKIKDNYNPSTWMLEVTSWTADSFHMPNSGGIFDISSCSLPDTEPIRRIPYMQKMPKWWIWCYWICPTSWSLNGFLTAQYGDMKKEISAFGETTTVSSFLQEYYGFHHDHLGLVAALLAAFPVVYAALYAYFLGKLNSHYGLPSCLTEESTSAELHNTYRIGLRSHNYWLKLCILNYHCGLLNSITP